MPVLVHMGRSARLSPARLPRHGGSWFSTESTSGAGNNSLLVRTIYRQLLKWCRTTGPNVPIGPIPPVTLAPPRIASEALRSLAAAADTDGNTPLKQGGMAGLRRQLPRNSLVDANMMVVPISTAPDLRGLFRAVFRLNSADKDPAVMKGHVALAFDAVKSLNELSAAIVHRKNARIDHAQREGVVFRVGEPVQHREERWRGVVMGWRRNGVRTRVGPGGATSLTTKEYDLQSDEQFREAQTGQDGLQSSADNDVTYDIIIDSGDAHLLGGGGPRSSDIQNGFPAVKQQDLEAIIDPALSRIRSNWVASKFDKFDSSKGAFIPNNSLRYEYPVDVLDKEEPVALDAPSSPLTDEMAEKMVEAVRQFAGHLERRLFEILPSPESRERVVPSSLLHSLSSLASGTVQNPADLLHMAENASAHEMATLHLQPLLDITLEVSEMMWQRSIALQNSERIRFPLGSIVKHTKYGYRGVVIAWDPFPTVNVSRWDGLKDATDPDKQPFYHVLPDVNDCIRAFGGERSFRYVCEENLEVCPRTQSVMDIPDLDLNQWKLDTEGDQWHYEAPEVMKFKYAESLGEAEADIVSTAELVQKECATLHLAIRDGGLAQNHPLYSIADALSIDKLQILLYHSEGLANASTVSETIKEIWKAHRDVSMRYRLDNGIADLLRGNKKEALKVFQELVLDDPEYAEAWNKKSTSNYMLGKMKESLDAAAKTLRVNPDHFGAISGKGLCYYETRRYDEAAVYFRKSLSLDPWSPISSRLAACNDLLRNKGTKSA